MTIDLDDDGNDDHDDDNDDHDDGNDDHEVMARWFASRGVN